jgi:hypothetical protein
MAQSTQDAASVSIGQQKEEPAAIAKDQPTPAVDNSVLPELPKAKTVTAFPAVARSSTLPIPSLFPPAPGKPGTQPSSGNNAPGQSKWVILAALIVTGAVVGTILLLRGIGGGGDDSSHPNPTGTVIVAGTPAVSTPTH